MPQNSILFVETRAEEQRKLLCRWVESFCEEGKHVQVLTDSTMAAQHLDQLLWSFSQPSFIPHKIITSVGSSSSPIIEPVVITPGEVPLEGFEILVCDAPANLDFMKRFVTTVHFVLLNDAERRQHSRLMWQTARDEGLQTRHIPYASNSRPPAATGT